MEPNKILNADILDILFEGKNKSYGAYELRKTYNSRIIKAMIGTGALLLVLFVSSVLANKMNETDTKTLDVQDTQLSEVQKDEPPPPPPPPTPPPPPPPPEIKQIQFTPPKIVKDEEVKPDEVIKELEPEAVISTKTVESENTTQIVQAPVEEKGTEIIAPAPKAAEEDKVFTKVEIEAEYPGGQGAWGNYLRKNLNAQVGLDNSAPPGQYKVIVRFIVAKDGTISDVQPQSSIGFGMEQEAVRVIKKGPKWTPAQQNGNIVTAYRTQPIIFQISEE